MPGKQPILLLLPFERNFRTVYDCVTHEDFIDANNKAFPMEWIGARRFVAALIAFYKSADQDEMETKCCAMYEIFKAFTRENGYIDGSDYNPFFEAAHDLKLHVDNGRYKTPGDWSETVEWLHDRFYEYSEVVYEQVAVAFKYAPEPCTDYSSEYFQDQMKLNYVLDTAYFDAMEKFKHAMAAAAYIRKRAPLDMRFACLRTISHDILQTMEGQPRDFILMCFGQQFAIAKKLGKTPEAHKMREHAHYMQNIVSKFALHDFSTDMAELMVTFRCYHKAAENAPIRA